MQTSHFLIAKYLFNFKAIQYLKFCPASNILPHLLYLVKGTETHDFDKSIQVTDKLDGTNTAAMGEAPNSEPSCTCLRPPLPWAPRVHREGDEPAVRSALLNHSSETAHCWAEGSFWAVSCNICVNKNYLGNRKKTGCAQFNIYRPVKIHLCHPSFIHSLHKQGEKFKYQGLSSGFLYCFA